MEILEDVADPKEGVVGEGFRIDEAGAVVGEVAEAEALLLLLLVGLAALQLPEEFLQEERVGLDEKAVGLVVPGRDLQTGEHGLGDVRVGGAAEGAVGTEVEAGVVLHELDPVEVPADGDDARPPELPAEEAQVGDAVEGVAEVDELRPELIGADLEVEGPVLAILVDGKKPLVGFAFLDHVGDGLRCAFLSVVAVFLTVALRHDRPRGGGGQADPGDDHGAKVRVADSRKIENCGHLRCVLYSECATESYTTIMRNNILIAALFGLAAPLASLQAEEKIDFEEEVYPFIKSGCVVCHRPPYEDERGRTRKPKNDMILATKEGLMAEYELDSGETEAREVVFDFRENPVASGVSDALPLADRGTEVPRHFPDSVESEQPQRGGPMPARAGRSPGDGRPGNGGRNTMEA